MNLDEILSLIANTGFPIVVASYFIIRMEEKLDKLAEAISELGHTIESKMRWKRDPLVPFSLQKNTVFRI